MWTLFLVVQLRESSPACDKVTVGIIAMKIKKSRYHFLSNVFFGVLIMIIVASAGVAYSGMVVVVAVVVKINNGELKQRRRRRKGEREKSNRFRLVQQQLCPRIMLFCTFLCRRRYTTTTSVKVPNFTFCRGREHMRQQLSFSFPEL